MFKETLAVKLEQSNIKKTNSNDTGIKSSEKLHFREILCPITKNPLEAENCEQCSHKETFHRRHPLGFTLKTMVCTFENDK